MAVRSVLLKFCIAKDLVVWWGIRRHAKTLTRPCTEVDIFATLAAKWSINIGA
jgi:hypothetical protein